MLEAKMSGMFGRRSLGGALAATVVAMLAPPLAAGSVTIGQAPPSAGVPNPLECGPFPAPGADLVQVASVTGNPYAVPPGGGVITSWRSMSSTAPLAQRLRLFSGNAAAVEPLAESRLESVGPGGPTDFLTRLAARGGELLGTTVVSPGTVQCANESAPAGNDVGVAQPPQPLGQTEAIVFLAANSLLNLSAVLEPDADADGFGDETQDAFIATGPKRKTTKTKAKFTFTGAASYECKLDRKAFKSCVSPHKLKRLKPGKHKLTVHAIVPTGEISPDVKHRWKVLPAD
jgi:hypothetical protein